MLSNILYGTYSPDLIRGTSNLKEVPIQNKKRVLGDLSAYAIYLNKCHKEQVTDYVRNIYINIMGVKNASKDLMDHIEYLMGLDDSKPVVVDRIYEAMGEFVEYYREIKYSPEDHRHSIYMQDFTRRLTQIIEEDKVFFRVQGMDTENLAEFVPREAKQFSEQDISSIYRIADQAYEEALLILDKSMASHMNFHNLEYYYNYSFIHRKKPYNTFRLIESGILLDVGL